MHSIHLKGWDSRQGKCNQEEMRPSQVVSMYILAVKAIWEYFKGSSFKSAFLNPSECCNGRLAGNHDASSTLLPLFTDTSQWVLKEQP